jgi:3-keto-5-aminohexanoate cleavage enzyme
MSEAAPVVICVAPNGARKTRNDHPRLPITPAELAHCAEECLRAGAAMMHLHVRDADGRHSLDAEDYRAALAAIRSRVGDELIVQVTTEAAGRYAPAQQIASGETAADNAALVRRTAAVLASLGMRAATCREARHLFRTLGG